MTCCNRPPGQGRTICRDCEQTTRTRLLRVGCDLAAELETTLLRQDKTTTADRVRGTREPALPWSEHAAQVLASIHTTLASWCLLVHDEAGADLPANNPEAMATHLIAWLRWLTRHNSGAELVHDIERLEATAVKAVDLPEESQRFLLGPCPDDCPGELWVHLAASGTGKPSVIRCKACRREWSETEWMHLAGWMAQAGATRDAAMRLARAVGRR